MATVGLVLPSAGRVAVATCAALPALDPDDRTLAAALRERGCRVDAAVWNDPGVDWSGYDLVVVRNTWDYAEQRSAFLAWAGALPQVANPADVLEWNTDKRYLGVLAQVGVPTVATRFVSPTDSPELPDWPEYVVKPTVSAGAADTARWRDGPDDAAATEQLARLQAAGRTVMLQPYLAGVDTAGESALVFVAGRFSHSARKGPLLRAGAPPAALSIVDHDPREVITAREATAAELAVAEAALDAVPGGRARLLYARVDLIPDERGDPVVLELELAEPSLFLWSGPGAADRLAAAALELLPR